MQIPGPHPRTAESKTLALRPGNLCFNKICRCLILTSAEAGELLIQIKLYYARETTEPEESRDWLEMTLAGITARPRMWASWRLVWCVCILSWTSFLSLQLPPEKTRLGPIVIAFCLRAPILHQGKVCFTQALGSFISFWTVAGVCCLEAA